MAVVSEPSSTSPSGAGVKADVPHDWPEAGTLLAATAGPRVAEDDMPSDPLELSTWFPQQSTAELASHLECLRTPQVDYRGKPSSLDDVYRLWDAEALQRQTHHLWLVRASSIAAFFAVMLAIVQLPQLEWEQYRVAQWAQTRGLFDLFGVKEMHGLLEIGEVASAVLAFVAVAFGIWSAFSHRWQLRRLQAEQCRFVKFGYLLRCAHSPEEGMHFLTTGIRRLVELDGSYLSAPYEFAKSWVRGEVRLTPMPRAQAVTFSTTAAGQMIEYFLRKRLRFQAAYFKRQSHRREFKEKLLGGVPLAAFFASLGLVFVHATITYFESRPKPEAADVVPVVKAADRHDDDDPHSSQIGNHHPRNPWALLCLLGAAGLPALGAWIRTYRGALEFARNANRFHAMWILLYDVEQELQRRQGQGDLPGQFEVLRDVEIALESEHRAWIRLMVEAEWFG